MVAATGCGMGKVQEGWQQAEQVVVCWSQNREAGRQAVGKENRPGTQEYSIEKDTDTGWHR